MQLKLKLLTAAAVMAIAGQASAAITSGATQGGSSLFLSVWDPIAGKSYIRNLGTNLNGFLPSSITTLPGDGNVNGTAFTGNKTPSGGLNLSFATDALFGTTFGASDPANIFWNVVAFDAVNGGSFGIDRVITTVNGAAPTPTNAGLANMTNASGGLTAYLTAVSSSLSGATNSAAFSDTGANSFAANTAGDDLNGGLQGLSSGNGYGSTLDFYYIARNTAGGASAAADVTQYGNVGNTASWTLASNGALTYTLGAEVAAVPVPAAAWLLGSGLIGMFGAARRRRQVESV